MAVVVSVRVVFAAALPPNVPAGVFVGFIEHVVPESDEGTVHV